jgi:hypothetical protein
VPSGPPRNWASVRIRGHGGGGFYPFHSSAYRGIGNSHGDDFARHVQIDDISGPLRLYHAQLQDGKGSLLLIRNSSDIAVYGIKNEGRAAVMEVVDSHDVLVTGFGAKGAYAGAFGKFIIRNSSQVTMANLVPDLRPIEPGNHNHARGEPWVYEVVADGAVVRTDKNERPALYQRGE